MVSHSPHLQRPVYYLRFQVFGKSHAAEGGQDYVTLYIPNKHTWDVKKLSKLKNLCLSKISQWWNDNAFLSKVFMAFLNKDSILLRVVVLVNDQFIKQYSICEKIIVYKNSLAALVSRNGLTCLKFCKLNLTLFATFFTWHLNVRVESYVTPRYLKSLTISSSCPLRNTLECDTFIFCLVNAIQTVWGELLLCLVIEGREWHRQRVGGGTSQRAGTEEGCRQRALGREAATRVSDLNRAWMGWWGNSPSAQRQALFDISPLVC